MEDAINDSKAPEQFCFTHFCSFVLFDGTRDLLLSLLTLWWHSTVKPLPVGDSFVAIKDYSAEKFRDLFFHTALRRTTDTQ